MKITISNDYTDAWNGVQLTAEVRSAERYAIGEERGRILLLIESQSSTEKGAAEGALRALNELQEEITDLKEELNALR